MISVLVLKIIFLITLFITTLALSILPYKVVRYIKTPGVSRKRKRYLKISLSFMNCFAAGVFIGTGLLNLFPSVNHKLDEAFATLDLISSFPTGEFILMFGFFLVFVIEQIVLSVREWHPQKEYEPLLDHESIDSNSEASFPRGNNYGTYIPDNQRYTDHEQNFIQDVTAQNYNDEIEAIEEEANKKGNYQDPNSNSAMRSLLLCFALSLHSLFEGLAIGLQNTSSGLLQIFFPVALHKSVLGFALGLSLVQSNLNVKTVLKSDFLFAVTSPIGIAIGAGIEDISAGKGVVNVISAILEGVACGTFLFVVFFEILPHEFMSKRKYPNRLLKTLSFILGFTLVIFIVFLSPATESVCVKFIKPSQHKT